MLTIRTGSAADAAAIIAMRSESWPAAYRGLLPEELVSRVAGDRDEERVRWSFFSGAITTLVAEETPGGGPEGEVPGGRAGPGGAAGPGWQAVGYAAFGAERDPAGRPGAGPEAGPAELYAIYVVPARWSAGVGRQLLAAVLAQAGGRGYRSISLWVLEGNDRARRFYERAGFSPAGERQAPQWLGGAAEIRYRRPL